MIQATLLLIDDDVTLLSRLADALSDAGYRVLKTSDSDHGGVLFAEQRPDLVLLEVNSAKGAGWTLLERMASLAPVIVVSQQGREEDVVRGLDAGAADYITKPYRSAELLARVRRQLRDHDASDAIVSEPVSEPPAGSPSETVVVPPPPAVPFKAETSRSRRAAASESVVMPYDDEHMLVGVRAEAEAAAPLPEVSSDLPLGHRLHLARQQRRVSLVQAENDLNIRMYYLQAIEEEKFTLLPGATLTETFVEKYAGYLGLDAKQALNEYRQLHYTQHTEPPRSLGGAAPPRSLPPWIVWVVAIILAIGLCVGLILWIDPAGATNLVEQIQRLLGLR